MKQVSPKVSVDMNSLIGKGSTGNVYKGVGFEPHPHPIAVKVIPLEEINNEVTTYLFQCQLQALKLTSKTPNQSIVKLEEIVICDNHCYIATQLLEGGTLKDFIAESKKVSPAKALVILQKLLDGYRILKQNGIIHRDLKPDNIIFLTSNENELIPKIIDFGYCTIQKIQNKPKMFYNVGSPRYMSPEAYTSNKYSEKSDIWAIGIILYQMLTGTNFDKGKDIVQTFMLLKEKGIPIPSSLNPKCRKILQIMLMLDPNRRATCQQVLKQIADNNSQRSQQISSNRKNVMSNQITQTPQKWNIRQLRNTIVNEKALFSPSYISRSPNPRASWLNNNENGMRDSGFLTRSVGFTVSPMARQTRMSVFNSNQQHLLRIQRAKMLKRSLNEQVKQGPLTDRNQNQNFAVQPRNIEAEPINKENNEEAPANMIRILVQNSNNRTLNQSTSQQNLHRMQTANKNITIRNDRQKIGQNNNKFAIEQQNQQQSQRKNGYPLKINDYFRTQRKITTPTNNNLQKINAATMELRPGHNKNQRINFFHQNIQNQPQPQHQPQPQQIHLNLQQHTHSQPIQNNQHVIQQQQIPIQIHHQHQHQIIQPIQQQVQQAQQVQHIQQVQQVKHQPQQPMQQIQVHPIHQIHQMQQGHQNQQLHNQQNQQIINQHFQQIPSVQQISSVQQLPGPQIQSIQQLPGPQIQSSQRIPLIQNQSLQQGLIPLQNHYHQGHLDQPQMFNVNIRVGPMGQVGQPPRQIQNVRNQIHFHPQYQGKPRVVEQVRI